jgi:acetolactate synthase-1/3 small subunit
MQHTISLLVQNETGVLSRISNLFSARGYRMTSITMSECMDNNFAKATIVAEGDNNVLEQIIKQLEKLIPVVKVTDERSNEHFHELVFAKVFTDHSDQLLSALKPFEYKILDINNGVYTIRVVCEKNQFSKFSSLNFALKDFEIIDIIRSGIIAI